MHMYTKYTHTYACIMCVCITVLYLWFPVVSGITEVPVSSVKDALQCLRVGNTNRITGSTKMNKRSSRSHAIFTIRAGVSSVCVCVCVCVCMCVLCVCVRVCVHIQNGW